MASLLALAVLGPASAQAATFTVNSTDDASDVNPGDEACNASIEGPAAVCTLRAAIEEANALGGTDLINVPNPGDDIYELTSEASLDITTNMQIVGASARTVTVRMYEDIDLPPADRVFLISPGTTVTLRGLSIENGNANGRVLGGDAGGNIYNQGTLRILESTITEGSAARGGGIANFGGRLTIEQSTLWGNRSTDPSPDGLGGAIADLDSKAPAPDPVRIENSTLSGNFARVGAGIFIESSADVELENSTITLNDAADRGGGVALGAGRALPHNSIVVNNTAKVEPTTSNCAAALGALIDSFGFNIESGTDCGFTEQGDQQGTDPGLGPLENNGGETDTHPLAQDSPAVDTGDPDACIALDQRGVFRPQGKACDVGAYEFDFPPTTDITGGPSGPTNDATPTFTFSSPDIDTMAFECQVDGADFTSCSSPFTVSPALGAGPHRFEVRAVDREGNVDDTPAQRDFTVDLTRPDTAITGGPDGPTNDTTPTFNFNSPTDAGATFQCSVDSGAFTACASPFTISPALGAGPHDIRVRAIDAAGNVDASPAQRNFTVDATDPDTAITGGPDGPTNDSTPTFNFNSPTDAGATFSCSVDGEEFTTCSSPFTVSPALAEGPHTFEVRARDAAGNVDDTPAQRSFTVDLTPPNTAINAGPNGPTNDATPTFNFNSPTDAGATFQCSVDGDDFTSCSSPFTVSPALAAGPHTFEVRARDAAGNLDNTPAQRDFTVDLTAPNTQITGEPPPQTNDPTPTFSFNSPTDANATFQCSVDGAAFAGCTSPFTVNPALGEGPHDFRVRAVDAAGNVDGSPSQRDFTVDLTDPATAFTGGPDGPTNDTTPTFTFNSPTDANATFQCSVDGAAFAGCTSPFTVNPALGAGPHDIRVRAIDTAGNVDDSPAQRNFTVDLTAPETTIDSGPDGPTNDPTPTFGFSSPDAGATLLCSVDGGAFTECTSPLTIDPALAEGAHHLRVRARDVAGNVDPTPARNDFTVDLTRPNTAITGEPPAQTNDATPTFSFNSPDDPTANFQCSVDGAAFTACSSPFTISPALGEGPHTFQVRARDPATNVDASPPQRNFTVDLTAPETDVTAGPDGPTNDSTPTFSFNSPDATATFQCSVDGAAFANCTSPFTVNPGLGEGPHTFQVRARDPATNVDTTPTQRNFTVDQTAPNTAITAGPSGPTNDTRPRFSFESPTDAGATFECSVDGAAFTACTSPHTTPTLVDGPHTFDVRAVDPAGNPDQTPARNSITLDTGPPDTSIDSGPEGPTNDSTPTFDLGSNEGGVTFECGIDGAPLAPCTTPYTTGPLPDGPHVLQVEAIDAVGNRGSTAARSFTVDTRAPETSILAGPDELTTDSTPTFEFSSDEAGARFQCQIDDGPFTDCTSPFTTPTLTSGRHTFRVQAIDPSGNVDSTPALGFDTTEFTLLGEQAGPPVLGESFNVEEASGDVFVSVPAQTGTARAQASQAPPGYETPIKGRVFVPLEEVRQLPVGSFVDTRFGTSRLVSARNARGRTQAGKFSEGVFQVLQSRRRRAKGLTTLNLKGGSFNRCRTGRSGRSGSSASAAQVRRRTIRRVRSNANGNFQSRGRHSSATVRGTIWITADRCDGTLTTVRRGKVAVRDFRRKRTVLVRAGKSYLAEAP